MRDLAWLFGLCLVASIGCELPAVPTPAPRVSPPPAAIAEAPPAVREELPSVPAPAAREESEPPSAPNLPKADPNNPPGPDYIWIKPYRKAGGITVDGYWMYKPAKPKAVAKTKPAPRVVATPPPVARNEPAPTAGRVWVNGYTRKDGTKVKGYWRNK